MKIGIIGGAGKMGKWFSRFFLNEGAEVKVSGRSKEKLLKLAEELKVEVAENNVDCVKDVDIVMISVLFQNFEDLVKEIGPHIKSNQTVLDITSVKELPVKIMHKYIKNGIVLGTHPMFGPKVEAKGQNFVLTPITTKEKKFAKEFKGWLTKRGFNVTIISPKKHDELMSVVLGFSHFIGLTACDTLLKSKFKELKNVSGTSFKMLLELIENVISSDPEFYSTLHMSLPDIEKVEEEFKKNVKEWLKIVKNKDRDKFIKRMTELNNEFNELLKYSEKNE